MTSHTQEQDCGHLLDNLSDYIDGTLQAEMCAQIEQHLKSCENCRVVVNTLKKTVELYETCSDDPQLPEDVKGRLFACLDIKDLLK